MPPIRKDSHMAVPAACATTPSMEKIPAPIIPPIPMDMAAKRPIWPAEERGDPQSGGALIIISLPPHLRHAARLSYGIWLKHGWCQFSNF